MPLSSRNQIDGQRIVAGLNSLKFVPPRLRSNRVSRPRLIERFNADSPEDVVLVVAPVAYGKSTLMSEWAQSLAGTVAWVTLEESDNDPRTFWSYVGVSLFSSGASVTQHGIGALTTFNETPIEFAIGPILSELATGHQLTTLMLDDYQVITNTQIHKSIEFFIDNLPSGVRVVFGSRSDLPIPTSRLRAHGRLLEIRATNLAFTAEEAAQLIQDRTQTEPSKEEVRMLVDQTEGWVMGLRAAAISLSIAPESTHVVNDSNAYTAQMPTFLQEEVLSRQTPTVGNFLVKTAFLDQLNADLCDYVLDSQDSGRTLDELDRADLFVSPIDASRTWYRIHPLVVQLLRERLNDLDENEIRRLRTRASEWFANRGQLDESIRHSVASQDWPETVRLLARLGESILQGKRPGTLDRWLSGIPREYLAREPVLCVQLARTMMFGSLRSDYESLLQLVESQAQESGNDTLLASVLSVRTHAVCFSGQADKAILMADRALTLLPPEEVLQRGVIQQVQCSALLLADRVIEAEEVAVNSFQNGLSAGNGLSACAALGMRAFINCRRGQILNALRYVDQAEKLASSAGLDHLFVLPFHRSRIYLELIQLESARGALDGAEETCEGTGYRLFVSSVHLMRGRLNWMLGDYAAAEASIRVAEEVEKSIGGIQDVFSPETLRIRIAMEMGDEPRVLAWVQSQPSLDTRDRRLTWMRARAWLTARRNDLKMILPLLAEMKEAAIESLSAGHAADSVALQLALASVFDQFELHEDASLCLTAAVRSAMEGQLLSHFWEDRNALRRLLSEFSGGIQETNFVTVLRQKLYPPVLDFYGSDSKGLLSSKETEVLKLLSLGNSNEKIAETMNVSLNTVKTHLQHIYTKLGTKNRTQAVAAGRALQLIP